MSFESNYSSPISNNFSQIFHNNQLLTPPSITSTSSLANLVDEETRASKLTSNQYEVDEVNTVSSPNKLTLNKNEVNEGDTVSIPIKLSSNINEVDETNTLSTSIKLISNELQVNEVINLTSTTVKEKSLKRDLSDFSYNLVLNENKKK